jgi:hypothetical protein
VLLDDAELLERVKDDDESAQSRAASLRALAGRPKVDAGLFEEALASARASDEPLLRAEQRDVLAALRPAEALAALDPARFDGERVERQRAACARPHGRSRADALLVEASCGRRRRARPRRRAERLTRRTRGTPLLELRATKRCTPVTCWSRRFASRA